MKMEKEDIVSVANILSSMKDYSLKLEEAMKKKDAERIEGIKREIIKLSNEIDRIL